MNFGIVVFSALFLTVCSLPANLYSGRRYAIRPKRQNGMLTGFYDQQNIDAQQNGFNESPVNTEGQYAQPPSEQLGPHLEGPTPINENAPQKPLEIATDKVDTKKKTEEDSDEDDDDANSWPLFKPQGRGRQPSLNFFPIVFGGSGLGRSGGAPSGAVAIANSFSTGRKGMANSNAVANGDPTAAMRNGNFGRFQQN